MRHPIVSGLVVCLLPALAPPAAAALFTGPFDTLVPSNPTSLSSADLDGDGDLDLIVCHYSTSLVTVLLNDGSGRFDEAPGSPITVVPFPVSAVIASFNPQQDSIPDVVVVGGLGPDRGGFLFRGDGTGRLLFQVAFGIEGASEIGRQAAAPDFNGEGYDDIVFTGGQVRLGSGSALVRWTHLPLLRTAWEVAAGDFDGDGHPDAAFVSYVVSGGLLQVFLAVGATGDFVEAPGSPLSFGVFPESISVADLDDDGDLDLAVTDIYAMGVDLLMNQGGGRFTASGFAPVRASYPRGIATADFDGDGRPDLAVGSNNSSAISVVLGEEGGGMREIDESPLHVTVGVTQSIVTGDLNGDGLVDLAAVDFQGDRVAVFLHTPPPVLEVDIDLLPGSDDNVIRLGSQGSLPVAVLTTDAFDATTVDPASVRVAGAPPRLDAKGDPDCHFEDVDRDHRDDLLCKIDKAAVQLHPGDTVAVLEATTLDGKAVRGQDAVRVLAGKAPHHPSTTRWPGGITSLP
jgi:hypothetical protein